MKIVVDGARGYIGQKLIEKISHQLLGGIY